MKMNAIPMAAAAAPTPMPAFAPVDIPELEAELMVNGVGVGVL